MAVSHKWSRRLVAVDDYGVEHTGPINWQQNHWHANEQNGDAIFRELPLAAIKEFRLQVRPFHWVEFTNVAIQLGQTTDVKVTPLLQESPSDVHDTKTSGKRPSKNNFHFVQGDSPIFAARKSGQSPDYCWAAPKQAAPRPFGRDKW